MVEGSQSKNETNQTKLNHAIVYGWEEKQPLEILLGAVGEQNHWNPCWSWLHLFVASSRKRFGTWLTASFCKKFHCWRNRSSLYSPFCCRWWCRHERFIHGTLFQETFNNTLLLCLAKLLETSHLQGQLIYFLTLQFKQRLKEWSEKLFDHQINSSACLNAELLFLLKKVCFFSSAKVEPHNKAKSALLMLFAIT
jgi:hypothetical protein